MPLPTVYDGGGADAVGGRSRARGRKRTPHRLGTFLFDSENLSLLSSVVCSPLHFPRRPLRPPSVTGGLDLGDVVVVVVDGITHPYRAS